MRQTLRKGIAAQTIDLCGEKLAESMEATEKVKTYFFRGHQAGGGILQTTETFHLDSRRFCLALQPVELFSFFTIVLRHICPRRHPPVAPALRLLKAGLPCRRHSAFSRHPEHLSDFSP